MHLLYLHGFNSSPQSHKALQVRDWLATHHPGVRFDCPLLSPYPDRALATLTALCDRSLTARSLVVGSSMGGFYATWVSQTFGCKGVLVNPAVRPWLGREYLLGRQRNFHSGEEYLFEQRDIDAFARWEIDPLPAPHNLWVLLQTGDEVLDYRQALDKYRGCRLTVEQGGDHAFQGFERFFPDMLRFWNEQDL
ncbi:MAG: YqiA/YcfP family alpha/beta fold hydrolase [Porticoccaceae bacterium]|nr:YqiA/YcfP family alpha/beta fold hydrolase [Pseudomonadota bacterium]